MGAATPPPCEVSPPHTPDTQAHGSGPMPALWARRVRPWNMSERPGEASETRRDAEGDDQSSDWHYMGLALDLADEAAQLQEVPVGCIIVKDDQIIGRGHNRRESWADPTAHAELLAIRDAASHLHQWRLVGTTVYCTLEPCPMCAGALVNARIERLVYGCSDPKAGACGSLFALHQDPRLNHSFTVVQGVRGEEAAHKLRAFFQARRKRHKTPGADMEPHKAP